MYHRQPAVTYPGVNAAMAPTLSVNGTCPSPSQSILYVLMDTGHWTIYSAKSVVIRHVFGMQNGQKYVGGRGSTPYPAAR